MRWPPPEHRRFLAVMGWGLSAFLLVGIVLSSGSRSEIFENWQAAEVSAERLQEELTDTEGENETLSERVESLETRIAELQEPPIKPTPTPDPTPKPEPTRAPKPQGAGKYPSIDDFSGRERNVYKIAYDVCGSFSIPELVRQLDAEGKDPDSIAYAYAYDGTFDTWAEFPSYSGCVDAVLAKYERRAGEG